VTSLPVVGLSIGASTWHVW